MFTTDKRLKRSTISRAVAGAIAGVMAMSSANAQQTSALDSEEEVERIFVTASKRPLTLQDTPIAVSVTSAADIEQSKIVDVLDLQVLVPSLKVSQTTLTSATSFSIRGFGSPSGIGTEPSVGVFIDGVFRSRAGGAISDLPRVERVEVLSGPQSTLFGKNASAGVVSVITSAPSFVTEGRVEATLGNYNQRRVKGYVTGGVTDELALSFSAGINRRDGFITSLQAGVPDQDDRDRWNVRGQAFWEPTPDVSLRVIADYSEIDEICCSSPNVISGPVNGIVLALGGIVLDENNPFARESVLIKAPTNDLEDGGISAHLDVDFAGFSLTSITAYRFNSLAASNPVGNSSVDTSTSVRDIDIRAFSQELRLTSTSDGPFSWIAGGFFFDEEIESTDALEYGPQLRPFVNLLTGGGLVAVESALGFPEGTFYPEGISVSYAEGQDNKDYSFFASADYQLTDSLTLTGGLNYTNDRKQAYVRETSNDDVFSAINFNTLAGGAFAGLSAAQFRPPTVSFPNSLENGKSDDSDATYLLRLAYKLNENYNFYISQATGFKSSSWDLTNFSRPSSSLASALDASGENSSNPMYGSRFSSPEYSTVTEVGMKVWYQNFQANLAIFDQSLDDFQVRSFDGIDFFQANAGKTSVDGFEFDVRYSLNKNWTFTLAGTYLDPIYDEFENAPPGPNAPLDEFGNRIPEDLSGTRPLNIPEKSMVAGIVYTTSFDTADMYVRADYTYESALVFAPSGSITANNPDFTRQVNNLGMSAGLHFDNNMSVQVWGRNLTDDENLLSVYGQAGQAGTVGAYINQPRTYGVTVGYTF
ncbi:MAG: ligand-gated channel protein [Alteromonadaceae bacterium]|uniref:TonB-dependent receptor n=1 Tax=Paraglaciecola chathamensis TaxID=368405 RepID=UPI000C3A3E13|nr:TonB-dependent receptor [Paraglaciecola agarilytica]MBN26227.1 ligand-gated channel protein [Alteromonadaceae bacterium]